VPDGATEEDDEMDDPGGPSPPVSWDWREVLAASAMTALGLVVVAGLISGISRSTRQGPPSAPFNANWSAIQFGTSWANVYFAVSLLAVLGISLWTYRSWAEAEDEGDTPGHVRRSVRLLVSVRIGLVVVALGSLLGLVAEVEVNSGIDTGVSEVWSLDLAVGMVTLGVFVLVGVGFWLTHSLTRH